MLIYLDQKKFLPKPIYYVALVLLCIAITRRKFIHINGYSLYIYWKGIAIVFTLGSIVVTLSLMIQFSNGKVRYVYPDAATLESSDNIFLETFGTWPGIGLVVTTLALQIFIRVVWCFYFPWPWSIYLIAAIIFRILSVEQVFRGLS